MGMAKAALASSEDQLVWALTERPQPPKSGLRDRDCNRCAMVEIYADYETYVFGDLEHIGQRWHSVDLIYGDIGINYLLSGTYLHQDEFGVHVA